MPTTFTKESKATTSFTKEVKPGAGGNVALTWDTATDSWNVITGTWDSNGTGLAATAYTKESKPTTSFTKEPKP